MKNTEKQTSLAFFGFGLALFVPIFLFNPDFTLLDLLPDCVGYLLLAISLRKLRDLNSYYEGAASSFFKVSIVSLLKFLSFFAINAVIDDRKEATTMTLLLMFGFGIGEVILLLPAWKSFFEGFSYLGFSYPTPKNGKTMLDKTRNATLRFVLEKQIIAILPELSILSEHKYLDTHQMRWYEFTSMFRVVAIAILLVVGIVWLVRFLRFLRTTVSQTEVFDAMEADYRTRVVKKAGIFTLRRIALTLFFAAGTMFAACDLVFDGLNLLPDVLCGVFFVLFFLFCAEAGKLRVPGIVLSGVYMGLTVAGDLLASEFHTRYSLDMVQTEPLAWNGFWKYYPFRMADTLLLCVLTVFLLILVGRMAKEHCGYVSDDITPQYKARKLAEIRRGLRIKMAVFVFFAVVARAADFVCEYVCTLHGTILGDLMGLITLVCSALAAVFFLRYAFCIYDNAKLRYMIL